MNCIKCNGSTEVRDSRPSFEGKLFRRRRRCKECDHRFSTYEASVSEETSKLLVGDDALTIAISQATDDQLIGELGKRMKAMRKGLKPPLTEPTLINPFETEGE